MPDPHANFAYSTVATAPSPATTGTSLILAVGEGVRFPDPASVGAYNCTIWPVGSLPTTANAEIVRVTAKSTDTLTIDREEEGSTARTVIVGDQIAMTITKKTLTDIENAIGARVYNNADLTGIVTATETALAMNSERFDSDALHDTVTNNTRLTAPIAGRYHIGGNIQWDGNTAGIRYFYIRVNGTTVIGRTVQAPHASGLVQTVSADYQLAAADYVELVAYQDSGTNRSILAIGNWTPEFWMHRIGS